MREIQCAKQRNRNYCCLSADHRPYSSVLLGMPTELRAAYTKGAATGSASWLAALAAATTDGLVLVGNDRRVRHGPIRVRKHRYDEYPRAQCECQGQKRVGPFHFSHDGPPSNIHMYY
jgi:hypothetical protein